jgi:anti-sigma factor ChrR (cupin superfamily)
MLGITGLADYFHHLPVYHAGNGMIQQEAATGTVIIDQIAETQKGLSHNTTSEGELAQVYSVSLRIIALPRQKSTGAATTGAGVRLQRKNKARAPTPSPREALERRIWSGRYEGRELTPPATPAILEVGLTRLGGASNP